MLHDIRLSKVWQEAYQVGFEKGLKEAYVKELEKGRESIKKELIPILRAEGKTLKEIATLLHLPLAEVRRLARVHKKNADLERSKS